LVVDAERVATAVTLRVRPRAGYTGLHLRVVAPFDNVELVGDLSQAHVEASAPVVIQAAGATTLHFANEQPAPVVDLTIAGPAIHVQHAVGLTERGVLVDP
jgi:hypothetical protein